MRFAKTNRIFQIIFLLFFGWTTINVISTMWMNSFWSVLWGVALIPIAFFSYKAIEKLVPEDNSKRASTICWTIFGIMFILQLVAGYFLMYEPGTDLATVHGVASTVAKNGGSYANMYADVPNGNQGYFSRYPNNQTILIALSSFYQLLINLFGKIPSYAPILLNVLAISVSVAFTCKIAKKVFGSRAQIMCVLICLFFMPYYTYTPYFYTDSLSMPFIVVPVFLFVCALQHKKTVHSIIYLAVAALLVFAGFSLKGSVIIVLVGMLVYLFLSIPVKRALAYSGAIIAVFAVFYMGFNVYVNSLNFETAEESYKEKFPTTHWIMMGLYGEGGYHDEDRAFTAAAGDYDQKKAANIKEIKKRILDYGPAGLFDHFTQKAVFTWSDGTYWISHHVNNHPVRPNILHKFVLASGSQHETFKILSDGTQLMLLLLICASLVFGIMRPKITPSVLIKGLIFGCFLFFSIWETRSRYLFNFTPMFILASVEAIVAMASIGKHKKETTKKSTTKVLPKDSNN